MRNYSLVYGPAISFFGKLKVRRFLILSAKSGREYIENIRLGQKKKPLNQMQTGASSGDVVKALRNLAIYQTRKDVSFWCLQILYIFLHVHSPLSLW